MPESIRFEGTADDLPLPPIKKRPPVTTAHKFPANQDKMGSLQEANTEQPLESDFLTDPLAALASESQVSPPTRTSSGLFFPDTSFTSTVLAVILNVIAANSNTLKAWSQVQQSTYTSLSNAWDKFAETDMQTIKQQATQSIISGVGSVLTVAASAYSLYKAGSSWKKTSEGLKKSQEEIRLAKSNLGDTGAMVKTTPPASLTSTVAQTTTTNPVGNGPVQRSYADARNELQNKLQQPGGLNVNKHGKALERLNKDYSIAERKAFALDKYGYDEIALKKELALIKKDAAPIKNKLADAQAEVKKIYAHEKKESTAAAGIGQAGAGLGQLAGAGGAGVYGVTTAEVHREKDLAQKATQLDHMLTNLAAEGVKKAVDLTEGVIQEINRMLQTFFSAQRA